MNLSNTVAARWTNALRRTKRLLCFALMFLYATDVNKCDVSHVSRSRKGDKKHGLGFLDLGRKNFITGKEEKYRNNLILTRIRNAEKLNATCIGKFFDIYQYVTSELVFLYRPFHVCRINMLIYLGNSGGLCSLEMTFKHTSV